MAGVINYGISMTYNKSWGYKEAVREILQNFIDFGEYNLDYDGDDDGGVTISNDFQPESLEFLKFGASKKGDNKEAIGCYGEGLKLALIIFHRENIQVTLRVTLTDGRTFSLVPTISQNALLGEQFGLQYVELFNEPVNDETFVIKFADEDFEGVKDELLLSDDIEVLIKNGNGELLDDKTGNIYVGGIFVLNCPNCEYSYNLKPSQVRLGRDRDFPNSFDIGFHTSKLYEAWINENPDKFDATLNNDELKMCSNLPSTYLDGIEARKIGSEVKLFKNNEIIKDRVATIAMEDKAVAKKVELVRFELTKAVSINDLIRNFGTNHSWQLNKEAQVDFDTIINRIGGNI